MPAKVMTAPRDQVYMRAVIGHMRVKTRAPAGTMSAVTDSGLRPKRSLPASTIALRETMFGDDLGM